MLNYLILALLGAVVVIAPITVIAEAVFRRNSKPYRFFRAIWLRLRELDTLRFGVTSFLLLFWGLCVGDDNFYGIWTAILMMLAVLIVVHADDFFSFKKKRKKAEKRKNFVKLAGILGEVGEVGETPVLQELQPLTPIAAENDDIVSA